MARVSRHATEIHYEVTGEDPTGPPVVLAHSFLCDGSMWRHQVPALIDAGRQVVNVDMRGHGRSSPARQPFSIYDLADDVIAVLDDLDADTAIWCGLSIGGMLSLRAALTRPERVKALVLADSDAGAEEPAIVMKYRAMSAWQRAFGPRAMLGMMDDLFVSERTRREQPEMVEDLHQRLLTNDRASISRGVEALVRRDDVLSRLPAIDRPALVLVGEHDQALPPARSRALTARLADAELVTIPGAGHLSALEQPAAFNDALLDFLTELS